MNIYPKTTEFLLFQTEDGKIRVETRMQEETVWLTQDQMAELFGKAKSTVNEHIKNIFNEGELQKDRVMRKFGIPEFSTKPTNYYNLDIIISVGYRVKSQRGTQFRIWATQRLREYLIKGFIMDDDRLKRGGGDNYFDELLDRIRDIRSSEKVFWRKVLDIYSTSIDYDPSSDLSQEFFASVQNKMHWAAHGHTAAEVIHGRADSDKENMGLTSWTGDAIRKHEVSVAKNYLDRDELEILNRIVTAYLEFAELQALNRKPMYMKDWRGQLDNFLRMSGRELLDHAGRISHEEAVKKAHIEYEKYRRILLEEPSAVEKHFFETVTRLKKLEKGKAVPRAISHNNKPPVPEVECSTRLLGLKTLKLNLEVTDGTVECPVLGCRHHVERQRNVFRAEPQFQCPDHGIYISPSTWEYPNEANNLLWTGPEDMTLLRDIKGKKRENRMARDNSEDALTWNVWRYLETGNLVDGLLGLHHGKSVSRSELVYWSWFQTEGSDMSLLNRARLEFGETVKRGSEPDLIIVTDKVLFFIEAKLEASNNTSPSKGSREGLYCSGGDGWYDKVFASDFDTIAREHRKYELLRFWLLGTWMAKEAGLDFHLVNLVPATCEGDIEKRFKPFIAEDATRWFTRLTWEEIYRFIKDKVPKNSDGRRTAVLEYMENKTVGFRGRVLKRAFGV